MFVNVAGRSLIQGFALGLNPLMAQSFGAGNLPRIGILIRRQWLIHGLVIIFVIMPIWASSHAILTAAGQPEEVVRLAVHFIALRAPAVPFVSLAMTLQFACISQRAPRGPATLSVIVNLLQLGNLHFLIHGLGLCALLRISSRPTHKPASNALAELRSVRAIAPQRLLRRANRDDDHGRANRLPRVLCLSATVSEAPPQLAADHHLLEA